MQFADVNRSGVDDVVLTTGFVDTSLKTPQYVSRAYDVMGGVLPGLLTLVSQNGVSTSIGYTTLPAFEPTSNTDWYKAVPQVLSVVSSIVTTNGNAAPQDQTFTTHYAYDNPVYDARERSFEGFRFVTVDTTFDASAPGTITRTEYATRAPNNVGPGASNPPTTNYTYPLVRGLPVVIETFESNAAGKGPRLSTQTQTYEVIKSYTGYDGAATFIIRRKRADTYVFDRAIQGVATSKVNAVFVNSDNVSEILSMVQDVSITIPSSGGKHLRVQSTVDDFGNLTSETDFGVDGVDDPIQTRTTWVEPEVNLEAAHGYIYRPSVIQTSYTTKDGSTPVGPVRSVSYSWGRGGEIVSTSARLSGTLALDRSPLRGVPPLPPGASSQGDHDILLEQEFYDAFGNIRASLATNNRCTRMDYDTPFAELPVGTTSFAGGCVGDPNVYKPGGGFTTARFFDRGFQQVTTTISPDGQKSVVDYDPFGRPLHVFGPSAIQPSQTVAQATKIFEYGDSNVGKTMFIHTSVADGKSETDVSYYETWDYLDGFGHRVVHLSEGGTSGWIASGYNERSANGRGLRSYEPYASSAANGATFTFAKPSAKLTTATYDALGRVTATTDLEARTSSKNVFRPLETDHYDAEQLAGGKHVGAYTTTTADGHSRVVSVTRHLAAPADTITTSATFLATGEMSSRTESHAAGAAVSRWMQYDSLGRMVLNAHPDTTVGFTATVGTVGSAPPAGMKAWRYAYNDSGELVGTSDPRGCGRNIFYDPLGRLTAEDYWPCTADQADYTAPNLSTGDGTEHFLRYDSPDYVHYVGGPKPGAITMESDRARRTFFEYDPRGRVKTITRQIARGNGATATLAQLANRYTPHLFTKTVDYDDANRVVNESTGADVDGLMVGGKSVLTSSYSARGALDSVAGSYGTLVDQLAYELDGSLKSQRFGDKAQTTSSFTHDAEHRLRTLSIKRAAGPWLTASASYVLPPASGRTTFEADLTEQTIDYDLVGHPTKITDTTDPSVWPTKAKPVATRGFSYDDNYRLTGATYDYGGNGSDGFVSPYDAEAKAGSSKYPLLTNAQTRVRTQTFDHDWLGNIKTTDDDQHLLAERSLGAVTNGGDAGGPHRLQSAANGQITTTHDEAGNLTGWRRQWNCISGIIFNCSVTSYIYTWDESNHLATARRDEGSLFASSTAATIEYAYSAEGERVLAHKVGADSPGFDVDVFPSLRLQGASYSGSVSQVGDYATSTDTERIYLATGGVSLGVVAYAQTDFETSGKRRVFFQMGDHLGSTSFVIDQETSELVERPTYQAYGVAESDFRPDRWKNFRETFRFNGKIDDAEVGLAYYGFRYLVPTLGRWASPDPLEVHALGSDPNPYAFAGGAPTANVDWDGLDWDCDFCKNIPGIDVGGAIGAVGNWLHKLGGGGSGGSHGRGNATPALPTPPPPPPPPPIVRPTVVTAAVPTPGKTSTPNTTSPSSGNEPWVVFAHSVYAFAAVSLVTVLTGPVNTANAWDEDSYLAHKAAVPSLTATEVGTTIVVGAVVGKIGSVAVGKLGTVVTNAISKAAARGAGKEAVKLVAGDAGRFATLESRGVVGDGLTPHHMPQVALGLTPRSEGGALAMETAEHMATRTYGAAGRATAAAESGLSLRTVLARDIRDVRQIVGPKYDNGLRDLVKYYYGEFPSLMKK
jgi:RHS repeat-associated protein